MGKFIVMDIVFYANSLNYDQGSGNYQELKKITKWDGKQYTFVSRYAMRYSLLETGRRLGLWQLAEGEQLMPEENQKVIQPSESLLLSGEILNYPEFDLFGYLITSTTPQNFREAPVKISHAVSLTPFNYDALFNANIGLANRVRKSHGEMSPNPFTSEEHMTYYVYSIVINTDAIGIIESYFQLKGDDKKGLRLKEEDNFLVIQDSNKKDVKKFKISTENVILEEITLPIEKKDVDITGSEEIEKKIKYNSESNVIVVKYIFAKKEDRVKEFLKAVLNLHRSIKGRDEDLSPKLLIMGIYQDGYYKTYKDKISLIDEQIEEEYDEIEEKTDGGKRIVKVKHITTRSKKPVFRVEGLSGKCEEINEQKILNMVGPLFNKNNSGNQVKVFCSPEVKVKLDSNNSQSSQTG